MEKKEKIKTHKKMKIPELKNFLHLPMYKIDHSQNIKVISLVSYG